MDRLAERTATSRLQRDPQDLCVCGHPRRQHVCCSELYPALCVHVDPHPIAASSVDVVEHHTCWCLEFRLAGSEDALAGAAGDLKAAPS